MPLPRTKLVGITFVVAGFALYGAWTIWLSTRTERPVDIPISMEMGHIRTPEFKINLNALYLIEIEVQKRFHLTLLIVCSVRRWDARLQRCRNAQINPLW
jgi:hypothetical protein